MPLLESKDVRVQGGAAAALANLATKRPEMAIQIVHEGGVEPLVPLLRSEVGEVQQCAIGCVRNLIRDPENAMNVAQQATEAHQKEKDISKYIKAFFDKKYGPTWHCFVGSDFRAFVTHESKHFIFFRAC